MGRAVKDSKLDTREARLNLKAKSAREPHWRLIHEGLHLGYRKGKRGGVWMVRIYREENGKRRYTKQVLGYADDTHDANGDDILSYRQAQEKAKDKAEELGAFGSGKPYTVADAMRDYLDWFRANKKSTTTTQQAIEAHILPKLGDRVVSELTSTQIRHWLEALSKAPARARSSTKKKKANVRQTIDQRARKATANRILTILKAALNHAWRDGRVPSDREWRKVRPFKKVDAPKVRYLSIEEATRLVNACPADFRQMVQAALLTGCRYGELVNLTVRDYHSDPGVLVIQETKGGEPRTVYLTEEGQKFFERATADREGPVFLRTDGEPWGKAHQQRPLIRACRAAGIKPAISFHVLRHTYGSMLAMKGVPLQVIAQALGHADTRITQKHYAHLMPSYVAETIRANLPKFGIKTDNVKRMKRKR